MSKENSRKLTTDEVNALMDGLATGEVAKQGGIGNDFFGLMIFLLIMYQIQSF